MPKYSSTALLFLSVTMITLLDLSLFIVPTSSTSRRSIAQALPKPPHPGFRVQLTRVADVLDRHQNLTKLERLSRSVTRGKARLHRLNSAVLAAKSGGVDVATPVRAGNGEFLMKLSIGTPAKEFSAIMDTGSDLVWTQCAPCTNCFDQKTPIFEPNESSSFSRVPCSSPLCEALPSSSCGGDRCEYFYAYGDSSSTEGILATETFTLGGAAVGGVGFGCGADNEGDGFGQGAGLVGLGRGPLSLVSQLDERRFSYCLTSMDDAGGSAAESSLLMGSLARLRENDTSFGEAKTTRLVKNPSQPSFYYLDLQGISVGERRLSLKKDTFALREDGSGGLIIDSGTTITYLERKGFEALKEEFVKQVSGLEVDESGSQGLDLCFTVPKGVTTVEVPKLVFHFRGTDLDLPAENYILSDPDLGLICLAMGSSTGMSIFGNIQQQNMLVVHDLEKETLSFVPTRCDKL